jgi:hypothetical protein
MNKFYIVSLLVINFSVLNVHGQKVKIKSLEDSVNYLLDAYSLYLPDLQNKRSDIVVMELPTVIPNSDDNSYQTRFFTENEAKELYKNDFANLSKIQNEILKHSQAVKEQFRLKSIQNLLSGQNDINQGSNFKIFFIDPRNCRHSTRDILAAGACYDHFKKIIRDSLYGVSKDVESLIFSKHYIVLPNKETNVPIIIKYLLDQSLQKALACLSPENFEKVKKTKMFFFNPNRNREAMLWMSSKIDSIFISPFLIRATYFYTLNQTYLFKPLLQSYNEMDFARKSYFGPSTVSEFIRYHKPEVQESVRSFFNDFVDNFAFVLGHELAHTYNDDKWNVQAEIRCDCSSLNSLRSKFKTFNPGIYKNIFQESIDRHLYKVWGIGDMKTLKIRFFFLNKFQNEFVDCDNLDFSSLSPPSN